MNPTLIITIIEDAIKYGPAIYSLVKEGITIAEAANKAAPDFVPHLENLIRDLVPHADPKAGATAVLNGLHRSMTQDQENAWFNLFGENS